MREVERRIENLEQALQPERPVFVYQEQPRGGGLFRRQGGDGRLFDRHQVSADVAAARATAVIVIYKTPGLQLDLDVPAVLLPDNGRTGDNG